MKIKSSGGTPYLNSLRELYKRGRDVLSNKRVFRWILIVLACVVFSFGFIVGTLLGGLVGPGGAATTLIENPQIKSALASLYWQYNAGSGPLEALRIIANPMDFLRGQFSNPKRLYFDVPFEEYQRLAWTRDRALQQGVLFTTDEDWASASLTHDDEIFSVRMRLKGDLKDHWIDSKRWSFRVKVRQGDRFMGMKTFILQHPRTSSWLDDWYYLRFLDYYGLIALRSEPVEVFLNGENLGIYMLKEQYDKILIEHNERREGPVFKIDDILWLDSYYSPLGETEDYLHTGDIEAYDFSIADNDSYLTSQFQNGISLLEGFRRGELRTSEVFDVKQLANFMVINDLFGSSHPGGYLNLRFYYNPITSRLEPIGVDNGIALVPTIDEPIGAYRSASDNSNIQWFDAFFSDEDFYRAYVHALEEITDKSVLDRFFSSIEEESMRAQSIIHKSYPHYLFSKKSMLYENQLILQDYLSPKKSLRVHLQNVQDGVNGGATLHIKIANIHSMPLEISGYRINEEEMSLAEPFVLLHKPIFQSPTFTTMSLQTSLSASEIDSDSLSITFSILGGGTLFEEIILPWTLPTDAVENIARETPNVESFPFISGIEDMLVIQQGHWIVDEDMIIPPGRTIVCLPGTLIDLREDATIMSRSAFSCVGSEENPVVFTSSDGSGGGLVIMDAPRSTFERVIFENLANPSRNGWELTGAVTTYESPVDFRDCLFRYSRSEDALNIIRSDFSISKCGFTGGKSDCFDGDFVTGVISGSTFTGCGNDGVDVSGSIVNISDLTILDVGDKGVSGGEESSIQVSGLSINGGFIGVASKDQSVVRLFDAKISNTSYALVAYQKKAEFGPSTLIVDRLEGERGNLQFTVEEESVLEIDGERMTDFSSNVYALLYGVE